MLYCHLLHHNDTIIKTQEDFFSKYMYLSLYCKGSKRVTQGLRVRGSWRPNINCNILTLNLWPSTLCLSRSPDVQPEALGPLCWVMAFFTASYQQLLWSINSIGVPEGPLWPCVALPTTTRFPQLDILGTRTVLTSVLTALYNSLITPTRSPTRSLKSHV